MNKILMFYLKVIKFIKKIFIRKMDKNIYYWYIGHEDPMNMTSINNPIPTTGPETASAGAGWRTIGSTLPTYSNENRLWDSINIIKSNQNLLYIALPSDNIKSRNEITKDDITSDGWIINPIKKTLAGVDYTIWTSKYPAKGFCEILY